MPLLALALVLLPGLVVVRAPWTAVAPISLAFWVTSAWWLPFASRGRLLAAALAASALLALLRLVPKHGFAPPPGYEQHPPPSAPRAPGLAPPRLAGASSLLVLGAALALLAPLPLWPHAPGPQLAFQTAAARLVVWRDGVPRSFEPLLPLEPFGAHAPALATLAADVSLLTGLDPAPALLAVVAGAAGLALVGLFALNAAWTAPWAAAAGALAALALAPWPRFLALFGAGEALLALGFSLGAAALLLGHSSRAAAVAAVLLLAAGWLSQPVVAALAGAAIVAFALTRGEREPARARRVAWALVGAVALASPGLLPLWRALTKAEVAASAASVRADESAALALWLLLAWLAPRGLHAALARRPASARAAAAAIAALSAALLVGRVHAWFAAGVLPDPVRSALATAAATAPALATICADGSERHFIPALASRRAGEPGVWIPAVYAEEWERRGRRPCDVQLIELRGR